MSVLALVLAFAVSTSVSTRFPFSQLPDFPDPAPLLDPEQIEYSIRDIAQVLGEGMTAARVRYHARRKFPNRSGWYRLDFKEATRLLEYIQKVRYQERQQETIIVLAQHLKALRKK